MNQSTGHTLSDRWILHRPLSRPYVDALLLTLILSLSIFNVGRWNTPRGSLRKSVGTSSCSVTFRETGFEFQFGPAADPRLLQEDVEFNVDFFGIRLEKYSMEWRNAGLRQNYLSAGLPWWLMVGASGLGSYSWLVPRAFSQLSHPMAKGRRCLRSASSRTHLQAVRLRSSRDARSLSRMRVDTRSRTSTSRVSLSKRNLAKCVA